MTWWSSMSTVARQPVIDAALGRLATVDIDDHQVIAYDVAHAAAAVTSAANLLAYGAHGDAEARLTVAFVADVAHDLASRVLGREAEWGIDRHALDEPDHRALASAGQCEAGNGTAQQCDQPLYR